MRRATDSDISLPLESHEDNVSIPAVHGHASPGLSPGHAAFSQQGGAQCGAVVKVQRSLTWTEGVEMHLSQPGTLQLSVVSVHT